MAKWNELLGGNATSQSSQQSDLQEAQQRLPSWSLFLEHEIAALQNLIGEEGVSASLPSEAPRASVRPLAGFTMVEGE